MTSKIVLITGANRGLGHGLVKLFLAQPKYTIIAAVRDPNHLTSKGLNELSKGDGTNLIVSKYDAGIEEDAFHLVKELQTEHGIDHLDIVIPNAGISLGYQTVKDVTRAQILDTFQINVLSVVFMYQATRDLLQKSTSKPIFAPMGSGARAVGRQPPVPNASYGASKAAVTWYGVRINAEDDWLNTFVLDPGFVQTDMGNTGAQSFGMTEAPTTLEESVGGMYKLISTASKEKYGGRVVLYTGEVADW